MKAFAFLAALATATGLLVLSHARAAEPPNCKLIRIDELPLKPNRIRPTLDGFINGQKIEVLIDTGLAGRTGALLERSAAIRLGVPLQPYPGGEFMGVGGESKAAIGTVREIEIGQATRRNWQVVVGGEGPGQQGGFIIGNSFFQDIELEFDLANNAVRLFKSQDCRGVSLAYWAKESVNEAPIWIDQHTTVDVLVNGKSVRAVLDSGAISSLLDMSIAAQLGVTSQSATTLPGRCLRGLGAETVDSWIGQFESFTIGSETIRNPKIYFADLSKDVPTMMSAFFRVRKYEMPEMILGADFLRAHRVLVARGHGKLFFTYSGGTVFPTSSQPCKSAPLGPLASLFG